MRTINSHQITTATITDGEIITDEYGDPYVRLTGEHQRGETFTADNGRSAHIIMTLSNGIYMLAWDDAPQCDWTPRMGTCDSCGHYGHLVRATDMSGIAGMVCHSCNTIGLSLA